MKIIRKRFSEDYINENFNLKPQNPITFTKMLMSWVTVSLHGVYNYWTKKDNQRISMPIRRISKDLWSFLGTALNYKKFIHKFNDIAKPLTNLTKKEDADNNQLKSTDEYQQTF